MQIIYSKNASEPIGPYSQAVEKNGTYFFSGQIALDSSGNMQNESIETETNQVLRNINAILKESDLSKTDIVKVDIYLTNLDNFTKVNKIYESFLDGHAPARVTIGVASLPKDARIEIAVTAVK